MKKNVRVLFLLVLCLCLVGCNRDIIGKTDITGDSMAVASETVTEKGAADKTIASWEGVPVKAGMRYARKFGFVSLSEAGVIEGEDDLLVHLYTIDKGDDMVLCYDPNCNHKYEEDVNGNPRCMASVYHTVGHGQGYYEGAVYFFTNTSKTAHRIYKMDTNSAVRELVSELPHNADTKLVLTFCGDKLYYNVKILHTDKTTGRGSYTYRLIEVNLIDGSYRFITEEVGTTIDMVDVAGNTLFMRKRGEDGTLYAVTINIDTLEETVLISEEEWVAGHRYVFVHDEDSYFYWEKDTGELGIKNIDGTVEKVLLKGPGESFLAYPSNKGMFYCRTMEYEGIQPGYYFMNLETGEITDVSEVAKKYNIQGYDGFYDAFVGYNLAEGSNEILNYTMWSKDKILNEAKQ